MYILLILILGLILRLISLNQSLWLDEATTALVAKMSLPDMFSKFLPADFHPPLYYLIMKFWTGIFGFSEVSLRIPSVIFGVGTIYLTYLIAKKIFNNRIGLFSATLMATSGLSIYYSQEARMYSLAAFLVCALIYLFLQKRWILFSIALVFLAMTDYVSLLIIPVFWLVNLKDWRKLTISHVPMFAMFLIWLPVFQKQLLTGLSLKGSNWWNLLGATTFKNAALIPVKFILGRISFDNKTLYGAIALMAILLYGFILYKVRRSSKLLWSWLVLPIILGILISFKIPTLSYFRFLFCLPALYILVSKGIDINSKTRKFLFAIVLLINLTSTGYYLFNPKFQREDWRTAAYSIRTDRVILPASSQGEALEYYGKHTNIVYFGDFSGGQKEIWLSRYVWQVFDPNDTARKKIESLGYNKVLELNFNGVIFYKYAYRN